VEYRGETLYKRWTASCAPGHKRIERQDARGGRGLPEEKNISQHKNIHRKREMLVSRKRRLRRRNFSWPSHRGSTNAQSYRGIKKGRGINRGEGTISSIKGDSNHEKPGKMVMSWGQQEFEHVTGSVASVPESGLPAARRKYYMTSRKGRKQVLKASASRKVV